MTADEAATGLRAAIESYGGIVISVVVLLAVELAARHGSPRLAAAAAALPTGMPLALFIVASRSGGQQGQLVAFADACLRGTLGTVAFAGALALAARRGVGPAGLLLAGYAAWFATWWAVGILAPGGKQAEE
mmetsp:Transcript_54686/g.159550  ORF Transcript_54686/g.159550 Transcript_54686/m.159550 type:complete len:132 (-) Transcript_54686:108-503(-)